MPLKILSVVALLNDQPDHDLRRGAIGTIVEDYGDGNYEVEFVDRSGETYALITAPEHYLLPLYDDFPHSATA